MVFDDVLSNFSGAYSYSAACIVQCDSQVSIRNSIRSHTVSNRLRPPRTSRGNSRTELIRIQSQHACSLWHSNALVFRHGWPTEWSETRVGLHSNDSLIIVRSVGSDCSCFSLFRAPLDVSVQWYLDASQSFIERDRFRSYNMFLKNMIRRRFDTIWSLFNRNHISGFDSQGVTAVAASVSSSNTEGGGSPSSWDFQQFPRLVSPNETRIGSGSGITDSDEMSLRRDP